MAHDNQLDRSSDSNDHNRRSKKSSDIVADWLMLFGDMYREETTEGLAVVYRETLEHLKPEILHKAFLRATKTSKFRPTPAEILEAANIELELLQPPKTHYEQIPVEERDAALEETRDFREALKKFLNKKDPPKIKPEAAASYYSGMTAEEEAATIVGYKRYLTEEANKDAYNKAHGIPPIPRSRDEQLAIYFNMSRTDREKFRKQVRP